MKLFLVLPAFVSLTALACDYPDEGGMPLRRAVTRIEMLPEVDAWAKEMVRNGATPQYLVLLDAPVKQAGRCYWPVEVRARGTLWRSYLVTPDGRKIVPRE